MNNQPYHLFIGRYQPLHAGHIKLMRSVLDEGKRVCVALRNTDIDEKNPFSIGARILMFNQEFQKEISENRFKVVVIPDIEAVCHGREVGWAIREIRLDEETEAISGTKIREGEL